MVERAAVDADVGLHAKGAALPHIHAQSQFEQVVNTLRSRLRNFLTANGGDDARRLIGIDWSETSSHLQFVELAAEAIFAHGAHLSGINCHRCLSHSCRSECSHRQHANSHLAAYAAECRISLVVEVAPSACLSVAHECFLILFHIILTRKTFSGFVFLSLSFQEKPKAKLSKST